MEFAKFAKQAELLSLQKDCKIIVNFLEQDVKNAAILFCCISAHNSRDAWCHGE